MTPLRFRVEDQTSRTRYQSLTELLGKLLDVAADRAGADLLVVHRNDGGVSLDEEAAFLGRGGLLVEYTGADVCWALEKERHVFGSYTELYRRLRQLTTPVTFDLLRRALEQQDAVEDALA